VKALLTNGQQFVYDSISKVKANPPEKTVYFFRAEGVGLVGIHEADAITLLDMVNLESTPEELKPKM
jgi:hypothetical protein